MECEHDIFLKRNELVTLKKNNLSLFGRKLLDYIYKEGIKIYSENKINDIFELDLSEVKKRMGINRNTTFENVKVELEHIQKVEFETYDNKHYSKFPILAGFQVTQNGIIRVALSPFLIEMAFNKNNPYYHLADFEDYKFIKSKYSKAILDLYNRYKSNINQIPKMEIEKFKDIMQYTNSYKNNDIERFVLGQAKKELKEIKNLELTWEIQKFKRKWKSIKLNIVEIIFNSQEIKLSEKLEKEILKARKNRFIDSAYSYKSMLKLIDMYEEVNIISALKELTKYNKEIINFSKIMISKIEDIKNSKKSLEFSSTPIILKKVLGEKDLALLEPPKVLSGLDITKEELVKKIMKLDLKMSKKIELNIALENVKTFEELENFMKKQKLKLE